MRTAIATSPNYRLSRRFRQSPGRAKRASPDTRQLTRGRSHEGFLREFGALSHVRDPSLMHDDDAIRHPDDLGHVARDQHDCHPPGGKLRDQSVYLALGSDVDTPSRLVQVRMRGVAVSHLARTTFC